MYPLLDKAEMCLETAPDSAFVVLDSLDRRMLATPELKARHALLYSQALEKCGIEVYNDSIISIALDYYSAIGDEENAQKARECLNKINENASILATSDTLKIQNSRIIEERYSDKLAIVEKDNRIREVVVISLLALVVLLFIIRIVVKKLKAKPDDKAMAIIRERLAVLDKIIASRISSDEKLFRSSEEELDVMMADREEFLRSTKIIFDENHPKFTSYLANKGLTDWEIGYCCLYTLGLKGKDIGEYIQKKRHYIISHEIRQRLGLDEHDTNISIYLRELLLQTER
ncbi:MAG: hypothetical protein MJY60_08475 [Bacteroidales bacterium]|nr:hypothetical protein [Bacteroidales bacterium]